MGVKFDKDPLAVEQNNYLTKVVNAYIVYDLDAWPLNPSSIFKLKNCLFGAANIVKNNDKEKWVWSGSGIAFDGISSWNFGNDFARNVIIFGVDNSSLSDTDNHVDNIVILKLVETKNSSKYLVGYLEKVKRPLVLILPKMSQYVKTFKDKDGDKNKIINWHLCV